MNRLCVTIDETSLSQLEELTNQSQIKISKSAMIRFVIEQAYKQYQESLKTKGK